MLDRVFHDIVTLIVVINPVGVVPLFIAVAGRKTAAERRRIAGQAAIVAAAILLVFIVIGQIVLNALGIDLASFRIAGGLVLLIIALRMVLQEARAAVADDAAIDGNVAVFPLAMPFIAGPASIMAVVLLTDNDRTPWATGGDSRSVARGDRLHLCLPGRRRPRATAARADRSQRGEPDHGPDPAALSVQSILTGMREVLHW